MNHVSTLVIGAGQAGLAMSHALRERSEPHVLLERGDVANSWRTERWDSLRLLTPNWQNRLPGYQYTGTNSDGFMSMPEVTKLLTGYASAISAEIETGTSVLSVTRQGDFYEVSTNRGDWRCRSLVLANGACARPVIPAVAAALPAGICQIAPNHYKSPDQVSRGGVLVVGASATGVQLAAELRVAGHDVMLAAGQHIRMPRHYRGRDIQWWMDRSGTLSTTVDEVDDIERARGVPSLQLAGDGTEQFVDLNRLQVLGVEIVGRLSDIRNGTALFSGSLANAAALSDLKMNRALASFDAWADSIGVEGLPSPECFAQTELPRSPRLALDFAKGRISTVIWATGYAPDFGWLDLPVFDRKGRIVHDKGVVAPGLYVLGLPFLRTRKSSLIDGAGADAHALADHLLRFVRDRAA
ncbi:NAD(P)-binding domain-containing protein [Frigidibacter sp. RF13]|uniref:NAD(P)-binding domain-containing protein n=1 Tax=Frigidibacter sp. RF13 TaxID=2997340 RepID=UPI0022704997|nr:NAD(P)-binding domain-containing protein [Frigidibacter sp. RF13]MCY1128492.1 NAD(P)-binding domain-containing protein [Frigidibacter sp. RF13]